MYASTYHALSINVSSMFNESFHCMGIASPSCQNYSSAPTLYSDKVSLGKSELQLSVTTHTQTCIRHSLLCTYTNRSSTCISSLCLVHTYTVLHSTLPLPIFSLPPCPLLYNYQFIPFYMHTCTCPFPQLLQLSLSLCMYSSPSLPPSILICMSLLTHVMESLNEDSWSRIECSA